MEMETSKTSLSIRIASFPPLPDDGQKPHQPLGADDKGQREEDQQVGGEHQEAEWPIMLT
ncbi:Uncharacterised protein [Escherichia coli]|uniref:Uncharacterized protein n=1 Tax=Escherichia coli TaxID=562 RepID=A0A376U738_ECOLX|nr:Uncharacterised protein [Escherichia coli]